jgi:hypothetical protein
VKVASALIVVVIGCDARSAALAQSKCDAIRPAVVGDLALVISRTSLKQDATINFVLINRSTSTAYVKDARVDQSRVSFGFAPARRVVGKLNASDGTQIALYPSAVGIETSEGWSATSCLQNPACWQPLAEYSVVEPQGRLPFSEKYQGTPPQPPIAATAAFSFTIPLIVRFSKGSGNDDQANQPKINRFKFLHIPLG